MVAQQDIPPPPTSHDYLRVSNTLDARFRRRNSMLLAIAEEIAPLPLHQTRQYMSRAYQWGLVIEAVDRSTGSMDKRLTTTEAFTHGSAAGLAIVAHAHHGIATGTNMVQVFDELPFSPEGDDKEHHKHQIAGDLVEMSGYGLMAMGNEAGEVIEGWEERYVRDATKQIMFRRGIGMTAFLACRVHRHKFDMQERAKLAAQIEQIDGGDYDWDAEWRGFSP